MIPIIMRATKEIVEGYIYGNKWDYYYYFMLYSLLFTHQNDTLDEHKPLWNTQKKTVYLLFYEDHFDYMRRDIQQCFVAV